MKIWYLLYGGTSEDGTGPGYYEGRTVSQREVLRHFRKLKKRGWYSVGYIVMVTDTHTVKLYNKEDFEREMKNFDERV